MKKRIRILITSGLSLIPLLPLPAAIDTKIVDADAQWVMHLDIDSLRESTLGKEAVKQIAIAEARTPSPSDRINTKELLTALTRVTAFGTNLSQAPENVDGALVLEGTPELRKMTLNVMTAATVNRPKAVIKLTDMPFDAYVVNGSVFVALPPEPIVLVSKSKAQLLRAHEVFSGKAKSLAEAKKSPLNGLIQAEAGSFGFAAAAVPQEKFFPEDAPQAQVFQMTDSASFHFGEHSGRTFVRADLHADSNDVAEKLLKIVEGLNAMLSLSEPENKHLAELARSVVVNATRNQKVVTVRVDYQSDELLRVILELQKEQAKHRDQASANMGRTSSGPYPFVEGKMIAQWKADQKLGDYGASSKTLVSQTFPNVMLKEGSVVIIAGRPDGGEFARIDYAELTPAAGGIARRIEAENMTLVSYTVLENPHASDGKLIQTPYSDGGARFPFEGAPGAYTLSVRYADESDGVSAFCLSVKDTPQSN